MAGAVWLFSQQMPIVYRYVDWIVAAPVQILCLYFLIGTTAAVPVGLFSAPGRCFRGDGFGAVHGRVDLIYPTLGFLIGLVLWLYVLGELFFGRLSELNAKGASDFIQIGFFWLRLIVTIGWALYPLCYLIVRLGSGAEIAKLMVIYNLADLVNQIAFVLAILATAVNDWRIRDENADALGSVKSTLEGGDMNGADIIAIIMLVTIIVAIVVYLLHWLYRQLSKDLSLFRPGFAVKKSSWGVERLSCQSFTT